MTSPNVFSSNASRAAATDSLDLKILYRASQFVDSGSPDEALDALRRSKSNADSIRNARGVCLMRLGRVDEALRLFRSLVLNPGCTWMKPDLPIVYYTNFCTVLLMTRHPAGCLDSLLEIRQKDHPSVVQLQQTIDRWQRSLRGLAWLTWKLGAEPNVPIPLDFAPGEIWEPSVRPGATPSRDQTDRQAA